MSPARLCILISTCEKYQVLAEWTADRIGRHWQDHPPVFFAGLPADGKNRLPHEGDARDWMGVTLAATERLLRDGFAWAYLILDDIPPMGRCNSHFLNTELPASAEDAGAALVSLLGWGQHRAVEGPVRAVRGVRLENLPAANRWRYSLHPGLWNLADLREILLIRRTQYDAGGHTPWNFERHQEQDFAQMPGRLMTSCYRIRGRAHVAERIPWAWDLLQGAACLAVDAALFLVRVTRGDAARAQAAARWLWPYCYYRGPYPMFWSGVMRQGKPGREWLAFVRCFRNSRVVREWKELAWT